MRIINALFSKLKNLFKTARKEKAKKPLYNTSFPQADGIKAVRKLEKNSNILPEVPKEENQDMLLVYYSSLENFSKALEESGVDSSNYAVYTGWIKSFQENLNKLSIDSARGKLNFSINHVKLRELHRLADEVKNSIDKSYSFVEKQRYYGELDEYYKELKDLAEEINDLKNSENMAAGPVVHVPELIYAMRRNQVLGNVKQLIDSIGEFSKKFTSTQSSAQEASLKRECLNCKNTLQQVADNLKSTNLSDAPTKCPIYSKAVFEAAKNFKKSPQNPFFQKIQELLKDSFKKIIPVVFTTIAVITSPAVSAKDPLDTTAKPKNEMIRAENDENQEKTKAKKPMQESAEPKDRNNAVVHKAKPELAAYVQTTSVQGNNYTFFKEISAKELFALRQKEIAELSAKRKSQQQSPNYDKLQVTPT